MKIRAVALLLVIMVCCHSLWSQDMAKFNLYKPQENAVQKIADAVASAKANKKHVFIQIGGNWCIWCARFEDFVKTDPTIDSLVKGNYVVYHLNYSKENYNPAILARYGYPQRFGFPVFLVLNGDGNLIHTQNSAYLEEAKSYSKEKVLEFFNHWTPRALTPDQYKEQ